MQSNQITIKNIYTFNEKFYNLFKQLVTNRLDEKPENRLEILDKFFITYKYPKLTEFALNIEEHTGEEGWHYGQVFLRNSYEMFLKENDPELYSIFRTAEDIWCNQSGIKYILDGKELKGSEPDTARNPEDELPF